MKRHLLVLTATVVLCQAAGAVEVRIRGDSVVRFADLKQGAGALTRRDRFIRSLSPFDRQARMRTDEQVSEEVFLEFVGRQVVAWQEAEIKKLSQVIGAVAKKLARFKLDFPRTVLLVQTTGQEEGRAAYCRGNAMVLPGTVVARRGERLEDLVVHELFHILSSHNAELRDQLYAVLGFKACNEIRLPASLRDRKITNPDAPVCAHYLEVRHEDELVRLAPVLFSSTEQYDAGRGGEFFRYLTFRLMVIRSEGGQWEPLEQNGQPLLLEARNVPDFFEKIGRNTSYVIHPEEVLAENFVLLVNNKRDVPTPRILAEMKKLLSDQ